MGLSQTAARPAAVQQGRLLMCERLLLTVAEAALRLGFGRSQTYMFIQSGDLPSLKIGGARRVSVADLEEFVVRLRATAGSERPEAR